MDWNEHVDKWKDCQRCPLAQQRGRICLARGSLPADVVFVGEAPGMSEDAIGEPFTGPAGRILDDIIARALPRGVSFVMTNLVACFPREAKSRGDNQPERGEILECRPRVVEFVNLARPRLIVRVGKLVQTYLAFDNSIRYCDIEHPASIIRMPIVKQGYAAQTCVVQIVTAYEDVVESAKPFTHWGPGDAEANPKAYLRRMYDTAFERESKRAYPDEPLPF